jgi:hypothetical protein
VGVRVATQGHEGNGSAFQAHRGFTLVRYETLAGPFFWYLLRRHRLVIKGLETSIPSKTYSRVLGSRS